MPITPAQKSAMEEVLNAILTATAPRGKRLLSGMFMDLVDRSSWPEYYELIPEPRCLKNIQTGVSKGRYKEATDVYTDLSLVFWNALFYNEAESQIAVDAQTLKDLLEVEWKKRTVLPIPRSSPPPSSAQKVHKMLDNATETKEEVSSTSVPTPAPPTPAAAPPAPLPVPTAPARIATPAAQNPTASTSTSNHTYTKPVTIRPKSAQRQTPDVDVEGISQESDEQDSDAVAFHAERDPQSEEIVKQLERGLPRWPGFGEEGWMGDVNPERLVDIVHALKGYKDIIGNRLATSLESVPEESSPTLHLSSTSPISLKQIETRTRHKLYKSTKEFDLDMARLFEKARRWHDPGTEEYGRTLLLQRFYQALTSPNPPAAPYISSTNFAALKAGPGTVKPVHGADSEGVPNVTSHRVISKDRTFVDEINYKGWKIKLADWVHLSNPDDPSRPIIGQVFRCWVSEEADKKGRPGITVSWYYRPEQTFHPSNRQFWEGEVFKTSHFADHPVEDIIEKIACQFTARHVRGRPRPPFWYVGFPLYVCDSRYNDRDRVFVRIKNWNSCVPEEVRQSTEFMPIYPFERNVYPVRHPSSFLAKGGGGGGGGKGAAKGPGGLLEPSSDIADLGAGATGDAAKKRSRTDAGGATTPRVVGNAYTQPTMYQNYQTPYIQHQQAPQRVGPDRSVLVVAGGLTAIGGVNQVEKLPPDTAKLVDRDPETNEVLWFAAPPLNMARAKGPRHSLAYLQFLASKRKKHMDPGFQNDDDKDEMDCDDADGEVEPRSKRPRLSGVLPGAPPPPPPPTVTETMQTVWKQMALDGQTIDLSS